MRRGDDRPPGGRPEQAEARSASPPKEGAGAAPEGREAPLPAVSLPKGGGAFRGLGEKFSASPATGSGSLTVPLATSPGRTGFGPELALTYDSGNGNGSFGFGWTLSLPRITRKTDKGLPRYLDEHESDVFVLSGAEDLVPVLLEDGRRHEDRVLAPGYVVRRYRPRVEGLFSRIERWTEAATGDVHWRSVSRDNVTTIYGRDDRSRVFDPAEADSTHPRRIFEWLASETHDDKGNVVVYEYARENDTRVDRMLLNERNRVRSAGRHIERIKYGNRVSRFVEPDSSKAEWLFEIVFDYGGEYYIPQPLDPAKPPAAQHRFVRACAESNGDWRVRPDPYSVYRAGFEVRNYRRCHRVLVFHHFAELGVEPCLVKATELEYDDLAEGGVDPRSVDAEIGHRGSTRYGSFLRRVVQSGFVRDEARPVQRVDGRAYVTYLKRSLPPLDLEYSQARIDDQIRELGGEALANLPEGVDGASFQWVDLDGEGLSGVLTRQGDAWRYAPNLGEGNLGAFRTERAQPSPFARAVGGEQLVDLSGDGQVDVVDFSGPAPGFYERTHDFDWAPFRAFRELPAIDWDDSNTRLVDLTGDGHADVLITEHEAFTWHPSLEEEGFGSARRIARPWDEEKGPRVVFEDARQSIHLADMSGDGLADLVRIENGQVCYWPNLGYGRFGAKVAMDDAPYFDHPDQFGPSRLRLLDVDGSGTSDIAYFGRDGARIYFNQAGNAWSAPRPLPSFPRVHELTSVSATDLLGRGTACLVWSSSLPADASSPLRFLDLMGQKPHLLTKAVNNLGAETHVTYASSTKFYLQDKERGDPWVTRLPFPVQVVERVETYDRVSRSRFTRRYAYHHGYFDGHEREFRGFGLVEQFDTEELGTLTESAVFPVGDNVDASSYVPPVLTKTWFHTGTYAGEGEGLSPDEAREACRALRGAVLRKEVYAHDGTSRSGLPYTITERSYRVARLQARGVNRHAIFLRQPREELVYDYERLLVPVLGGQIVDPVTAANSPGVEWRLDPRVEHTLALEVDDFGHVVQAATVGYARRHLDPLLPQAAQDAQARTTVVFKEKRFTNPVDDASGFRTPLEYEAKTFELTGYAPSGPGGRFRAEDFVAPGTREPVLDDELSYEEAPTLGRRQRRLIEHVRKVFRRDDLLDSLPLGEVESMALPFETYKLALTRGLVREVFDEGGAAPRASDAMLASTNAGYVHSRDESGQLDEHWWIPSGRVFFSPGPGDTPGQERAFAREHFFLPHRARDPFHTAQRSTETFVSYDGYHLLVLETRDALGNRVTVGERHEDPAQPLVAAGHDYRVLQPALVMDPNRNRRRVAFDALGSVVATAVMGKPEDAPALGDTLRSQLRADLTDAEIDAFFAAPKGGVAAALLDHATSRIVTDPRAYARAPDPARATPVFTATITRETHVGDLAAGRDPRTQTSFSYTDGFGREVQTKLQAEAGPGPERDHRGDIVLDESGQPRPTAHAVDPRWVGSGWTVFDNKGKPVQIFEPFFTDTHRFELDVRIGNSPVHFYDPAGRAVATLHPNHTWQKVVFGPWGQAAWDTSDTVDAAEPDQDPDVGQYFARLSPQAYRPTWHALRTDPAHLAELSARYGDASLRAAQQAAARQSELYSGTPTVVHADPLGRPVATVVHNRTRHSDSAGPTDELATTCVAFDVEGHRRAVVDAMGRLVVRSDYDMLGNRIHQATMEAGRRWMLGDVAGKPLFSWTERDHRFRTDYDALQRPTGSFLSEAGGPEVLLERTVYGESRADPEQDNLRGQVIERYDQAGVVLSGPFDFKGNLLHSSRRLVETVDVAGQAEPAYRQRVDWTGAVTLAPERYLSTTRYDALDRPTQLVVPHSDRQGARINVVQPRYNEANLIESTDVWLDHAEAPAALLDPAVVAPSPVGVVATEYDAKARRVRIEYAATSADRRLSTQYDYDPETSLLTHLYSRRGAMLQDLRYSHDVAGNITHIQDEAQSTIFFANARVEPSASYTYDAQFRLIEASGREHLGQVGGAPIPYDHDDGGRVGRRGLPHPNDGQALARYVERYFYDLAGNITAMRHSGSDPRSPGWTRSYRYDEASQLEPGRLANRLTSTSVGQVAEVYSVAGDGYDAHGNLLGMPHLQAMQWSERDQLRMTQRRAVGPADEAGLARAAERTWYVYGHDGQRVRKVTEDDQGRVVDERIYLGGLEVYKRARPDLVRETLHVLIDDQRVAIVESRVRGQEEGIPATVVRNQLGNHLGSASLEVDERGRVVSYEEYSPYGSTVYQAARGRTSTPKRYRYSAKERDEESGLYYHEARYYAPWLGRWTSGDPAQWEMLDPEASEGAQPLPVNAYRGMGCNPVGLVDLDGLQDTAYTRYLDRELATPEGASRVTGIPYTPPPPLTPEQAEAVREGERIGARYGQFEADLEQFNNLLHREWGGVSVWQRMSAADRQQIVDNVIEQYNRLPGLTEHFDDPALASHAQRGFNRARQSTYSNASLRNWVAGILYDIAPFAAAGLLTALMSGLRRAGARIVIDLMGGRASQIPGAINVDIAATSGIRANVMEGLPLRSGIADEVIATNPYLRGMPRGSNAANTWMGEAARVLRPGGRMTVTGNLGANKFVKLPTAAELERLGLRVVEGPGPVRDPRILAQRMFRTDGRPIDISTLSSYVLERVR